MLNLQNFFKHSFLQAIVVISALVVLAPHPSTFPLPAFTSPRTFFALIRRSTDPFVGRVGRRGLGATKAARISSASL